MCVSTGAFDLNIVAVTCETSPGFFEMPAVDGPSDFVDLYIRLGCQADEGTTVEARTQDGRLIDSCVVSRGVCTISGPFSDLPLTLTQAGLEPGVVPDTYTVTANSEALNGPARIAVLENLTGTPLSEPSVPDEPERLVPVGDLACAVKTSDHWDIWMYSFDTQQNTQLTSNLNSDQWAPAYSHDGSQLAYISDQTDGTNQIWMMNPDGSNQHQISNWYGSESILYAAWSPDDTELIVTLSGDGRRLVKMPATGGDVVEFIAVSSSFASTGGGGSLVYASENDPNQTKIYLGLFSDPLNATSYAEGDTPNLTPDGMFATVQIGDPGSRYIETYTRSPLDNALPIVPRSGDDSNPVWLTTDHVHLAFVSSGPNGETIQVHRLWTDFTTPIEIAPHDRVWYLSKRFTTNLGATESSLPGNTGQEPQSQGTGSIEVHAINCPPGFTGPDFYTTCHGNGENGLTFQIESETVFKTATTVIAQSPGPGIAWFEDLPPGTYGLDFLSKFVEAPAYVFCSPDQGETVLVDQLLAGYHDPVSVPVYDQATVCDWYLLY